MKNFLHDLEDVAKALDMGAPSEARRILAGWTSNWRDKDFAFELDRLLAAGLTDDARRRVHVYLNPKFDSPRQAQAEYDFATGRVGDLAQCA